MKRIIMMSVVLISLLGISTVQAFTFDKVYVFGDSLSDEGYQDHNPNLFPVVPTGKTPLWTTPGGHTWAYYLAQRMGLTSPTPNNINPLTDADGYVTGALGGTDYAAGGATTGGPGYDTPAKETYNPPSLIQQVCQYTTGGRDNSFYDTRTCQGRSVLGTGDPNALYIIFIGANDIFSLVAAGHNTCDLLTDAEFEASAINVRWTIQQIQENTIGGDPHILVIGLPDISRTPASTFDFIGSCIGHFGPDVKLFNDDEKSKVTSLNAPNILFTSIFDMMDSITTGIATVAKPVCVQGYCFVNNSLPACTTSLSEQTPALSCVTLKTNSEAYVFDDDVHPTDRTHQYFAAFLYEQLHIAGWV